MSINKMILNDWRLTFIDEDAKLAHIEQLLMTREGQNALYKLMEIEEGI